MVDGAYTLVHNDRHTLVTKTNNLKCAAQYYYANIAQPSHVLHQTEHSCRLHCLRNNADGSRLIESLRCHTKGHDHQTTKQAKGSLIPQFYTFKIVSMTHFRSRIHSRYHVLIYFAVFHEKPAANLPEGTKVVWENKQIVFVHPDFKAIQHASNSLFNKLKHYYLHY